MNLFFKKVLFENNENKQKEAEVAHLKTKVFNKFSSIRGLSPDKPFLGMNCILQWKKFQIFFV